MNDRTRPPISPARKLVGRVTALGLLAGCAFVPAGMLAWQLGNTALGTRAWQAADPVAAAEAHQRATTVNLVERWIAWYNLGVAHYDLARWDGAADDFEQAARLAPADAQCQVRLNWSAALEAGGDAMMAAGEPDGALARWAYAKVVLAEVNCANAEARDADVDSLADQWDRARERLDSKTSGQPTQHDAQPDTRSEDPNAQDQLDERQQQAQQQRQQAQDAASQAGGQGGPGERRW